MTIFRSTFLFVIAALIGASLHMTSVTTSAYADEYGSSSSSWSSMSSSESSMTSSSSFMSSESSTMSSTVSSSSSDVSSSSFDSVSSPSSNDSCNLSISCVVDGLADKAPGADLSGPKDPATDWEAARTSFNNKGDLGLSVLYYNVACPAGCVRAATVNQACDPNARKYDIARADLSEYQQPPTQAYGCKRS